MTKKTKKISRLINVLLLLLLSFCTQLKSQEPTTVSETTETIGDVHGNALHVRIHRANRRLILKRLKADLKEKSEEVKVKGNRLTTVQTKFPGISKHEIKVYAKLNDYSEDEHELWFIFLNGDQSVSSENNFSAFNSAKTYVFEFANRLSRESNSKNHDQQLKKLRSLESDLRNLKAQNTKARNRIKSLRKTIKKKEKVVSKIDSKKSLDNKSIELRKKAIEKILKSKEKINDLDYDIEINQRDQEKKEVEITNQKEILYDAKKDLEIFN